jgi:HD-like signal output (HDOD) protein
MLVTLLLCGAIAWLVCVGAGLLHNIGELTMQVNILTAQKAMLQDDIVALNDELTEAYHIIAVDTQLLTIQERISALDDQKP